MDPIEAFLAARTFTCPTMHVRMTHEACVERQNRPPDPPSTRPDLAMSYFDRRCRLQRCKLGAANARRLGIALVSHTVAADEPDAELRALLRDEERERDAAGDTGRRDR